MGLKEIVVVVRPEKAIITEQILLENSVEYVLRHHVEGRGKEMGQISTKTGKIGDGKIFVTPVERALTIRTGQEGL